MKRYIVIILVFLLYMSNANASKLSLDIDISFFPLDEGRNRLELYYSFPDNSLTYIENDGRFKAALGVSAKFFSTLGIEYEDDWKIPLEFAVRPDSLNQMMFAIRAFPLKFNELTAEIKFTDLNDSTNTKTLRFPVNCKQFNNDRIEASDLILSYIVLDKDSAGAYANQLFYRNGLYVYPNPSNEYYGNKVNVALYYELYNAQTFSPEGLTISYRILNGAAHPVFTSSQEIASVGDAFYETEKFSMEFYPTGTYTIEMNAKSKSTNDSLMRRKKFYLINPDVPASLEVGYVESLSFETSEFATLSEERIDDEFRKIRMLATKPEIKQYKLLTDPVAKAKFIFRFWLARHTDSTSTYNTALVEHRKRIEKANTFYSIGGNNKGWDSDRGHTLLKYGEPTRIERVTQNGNERAYEVWFYGQLDGGSYFYFVDIGDFNNYRLVHSTKLGEVYYPDWQALYLPISKENRKDYELNSDDGY